jgi:MFS family permease
MSFTSNVAKGLGAGGLELGIISAVFILAGLLASHFITGTLAEKIGDKRLTICGFLLIGRLLCARPLCPNLWCIYLCQFVGGLGRSFIMTLMMSNSVKHIAPEKKSTAMGIYQSIYSLGMTAGPMLMGALLERFTYFPAYLTMAGFAMAGRSGRLPPGFPARSSRRHKYDQPVCFQMKSAAKQNCFAALFYGMFRVLLSLPVRSGGRPPAGETREKGRRSRR